MMVLSVSRYHWKTHMQKMQIGKICNFREDYATIPGSSKTYIAMFQVRDRYITLGLSNVAIQIALL